MPPAIPPKTSEPLRKKLTENNSEVKKLQLMAKEIEKVGREPEESETSPPTETPPKPIKKTTVTTKVKRPDDKTKRISSAVADRVPKKTAQRAKGSLALEKVDHESPTKKKIPSSVDRMSRPGTREDDPGADVPHQTVALKPLRVRSVRKIKAVKPEGERKTPEKKQKQAAQEDEKAPPEEKPPEEEEEVEVAAEIPPPQEVPKIIPQPASATCSFFEKIQQGVRAYFSVRGNFKSDFEDKDKKVTEGGINLG